MNEEVGVCLRWVHLPSDTNEHCLQSSASKKNLARVLKADKPPRHGAASRDVLIVALHLAYLLTYLRVRLTPYYSA